jgi:phosphatidylglycerol---prolipoprotein diacylglyceryl transferase
MYSTILQFGSVAIRSYSLMLAIAFFVGTVLAIKRARRFGMSAHDVVNFTTIIIVSSIVGSRVLFVLEHAGIFLADPIKVFTISGGGLSYHGGLLLAVIGLSWWCRRVKISMRSMLEIFAPSLALGYSIVRIGCFLNGCCFGTPSNTPLGVVFPLDSPAGMVYKGVRIHPVQLYSAFFGLVTFCLLLGLEKKVPFHQGTAALFFLFLILSALERFFMEFLRYHSPGSSSTMLGWFTEAQAYSLGIFIFSIIMVERIRRKKASQ